MALKTTWMTVILALFVAALPLAAAQHGPPPGYDDPLVYAQDYAAQQAGDAQADPVGYASGKATTENLTAEAQHAAWLACWTAWSADVPAQAACAQFFTAPVEVTAPVDAEAHAEAEAVIDSAETLVGEVTAAANGIVTDPASAAEQVGKIVAAVTAFVGDILDILGLGGLAVLDGLLGALQGVLDLLDLPIDGLGVALDGLGLGAIRAGDGIMFALDGSGAGAVASVDAVTGAATGTVDAVASAATATVSGVAGGVAAIGAGLTVAGQAVGTGAVTAAEAVLDGVSAAAASVADAAESVADGVAAAADSVRDAVRSLFADSDAKGTESGDGLLDDGPSAGGAADNLVDKVFGLLS